MFQKCLLSPSGRLIAPMMAAASTPETSGNFYQPTRLKNPEDGHLQVNNFFACSVLCATVKLE
jgi:hypothetical protein